MKTIGVIPARYGATRFPAKPLAKINGFPMIEWVIRGVKQSANIDEVILATDNKEIADVAKSIDCRVVMTDPDLASGTDRVWAAIKDVECDVVLNIQGDEPLVNGAILDELVQVFKDNTNVKMATLAGLLRAQEVDDKNAVKVILNAESQAIYFSRFGIPFSRCDSININQSEVFKHIGIYGFKKEFLNKFCSTKPTYLEKGESLEQLRALYLGVLPYVKIVEFDSVAVDVPGDILKVEAKLNMLV